MTTLVLTVIGHDQTGLVDALAAPIAAHGGSLDRSHLARLAGEFAGILVVTVPDAAVAALTSSLDDLNDEGLLDVRVSIASTVDRGTDHSVVQLHLIGQDRPGIIREISAALASRDVGIVELETGTSSAPMSAERLFEARATLAIPVGVDPDDVRNALEEIANELMVDLDFDEVTAASKP